ncbi:hypothetical protein FRC10_009315 [Ceratobasidium sp. 414]|nr:hypothetical protein FRC10_009315 [Ceratobasidium sp. 414]
MPPPTHSRLSSRHTNPIEPPIGYDPQEEARIRLEQEIGGISLDLSRTGSPSMSLEYGRHGAPSPRFEGVPSFARYDSDLERSRDASARRSARQNQSLRTFDDSFDGGHTQSTAAHHASALTVGAGLGYGGALRPLSRAGSGVEYDPDRELSEMLKRRGRVSVLDDTNTTRDRTRTVPNRKYSQHLTSDPLIVDDTAELDQLLETGHLPEHTLQANPRIPRAHPREHDSPRADLESQSSFHRSEADDSTTGRRKPRLADALGGAFSPKRPRTMTSTLSPTRPLPAITSMSETSVRPSISLLASRPSNFPSAALHAESSVASSNGTQRARLEANTAANARRALAKLESAHVRNSSAAAPRQEPVVDRQRAAAAEARAKALALLGEPMSETRNRTIGMSIHLPDVTGLTAAVESPSKPNVRYRDAQVGMLASGLDADRTMTNAQLEQLSERLRELERENGTARRRVRELEMELEYCKAEVEREKTRANIQEAERTRANEKQVANEREERDRRLRQAEAATAEWETRYREVVEEKKALEALVATLQSHLARMTSEVEEHQRTIEDLRSMHERDAAELEVKTAEVAAITAEVERLAAECERLRGVVEEGLRERRQIREVGSLQGSGSQSDFEGSGSVIMGRVGMVELSAVAEEDEEENEIPETDMEQDRSVLSVTELAGDDSAMRSGRVRTDRATLGSASRTLRFMDPPSSHSDDLTPELERSQSSVRSAGRSTPQDLKAIPSRSSTPVTNRARVGSPLTRRSSVESSPGPSSRGPATTARPSASGQTQVESRQSPPPEQRTPPRQEVPVPQQPGSPSPQRRQPSLLAPQSPPFPRIRGAQLERLFFSVPEHDERTCTACCGRRRVRIVRNDKHEPERVRERERANWRLGGEAGATRRPDDDEGYVEGDEEVEVDMRRPPPQTVLVKVVRELEDDFAHYKAIYIELADQYRIIGPASNVAKRNVLAEHLKEVIDTLEKKGDQIASLYDLLQFNDKPVPGSSSRQRV